MWLGKLIKLQPGQFVTGRKKLSQLSGVHESSVERILNFFEKEGQIEQQKSNKYRLITIINWEQHQNLNNQRTTTEQPLNTINNNNNINNLESMSWKNYNEDGHYEDEAIDLETGLPTSTPKGNKKKTRAVDADVLAVFELFNNPAKALWRMREIERIAAQTLFEVYGLETLQKRIARIEIEKQKKDPYFPEINTPSQLLDKMSSVERYLGI